MTEVSNTTAALIAMLQQRDAAGRAKYGATLDRTDLTLEQWLQHQVEELLDGAGYALAAMRTLRATPAASVSERARELLAAAYRQAGNNAAADKVLDTNGFRCTPSSDPALRAIEQALTQQRGDEPAAWMVEWTDNAGDPTRYIAYCEEDAADKLGVLSDGEAATAKVVPLYTTPQPRAGAGVPEYRRGIVDAQHALHDVANRRRHPEAVAFAQELLDRLVRMHGDAERSR